MYLFAYLFIAGVISGLIAARLTAQPKQRVYVSTHRQPVSKKPVVEQVPATYEYRPSRKRASAAQLARMEAARSARDGSIFPSLGQ